jgi:hypothetical protein
MLLSLRPMLRPWKKSNKWSAGITSSISRAIGGNYPRQRISAKWMKIPRVKSHGVLKLSELKSYQKFRWHGDLFRFAVVRFSARAFQYKVEKFFIKKPGRFPCGF